MPLFQEKFFRHTHFVTSGRYLFTQAMKNTLLSLIKIDVFMFMIFWTPANYLSQLIFDYSQISIKV